MDNTKIPKLSNSFSTGNGGGNFERHVQAVFLLALLVDGFSPILEMPIERLDFQGKRLGYDTDDLIVTSVGTDAPKILCQIKRDIRMTSGNDLFQEVINAAWSDFKKSLFRAGKDKIVLATGIITKDTVSSLRYIYDQAIHALDAEDFFTRIEQSNHTSEIVRSKFAVLKKKLTFANNGTVPDNSEIWCFCKSFVLLVFDVDYQSSVNKMLIDSLIKCQSSADTKNMWAELSEFAGECNQSAGSICLENIPEEIKELFDTTRLRQATMELNQQFVPTELWAVLSLIGTWNEKNKHDLKIVEQITGLTYDILEEKLHQLIIEQSPYISNKNGIWKTRNREILFQSCIGCFFDRTIECAFNLATEILKQKNKRFNQNNEFSQLIPETGAFQNSEFLREGLVQGLCMLSNCSTQLSACSDHIIESCSFRLIRDVFADCNWTRFASLYDILPLIAEINPKQYLKSLEEYILKSKAELINLFPRKGESALFSQNFIYGIIWSIEVLAWDEKYLVSCIRCLGELAEAQLSDGDNSAIVVDVIRNILLPWYPQTMASIDKQKSAVKALQVDMPDIGWAVIKSLLPSRSSMTGETQKPKYIVRNIPKDIDVSDKTVMSLFGYYASVAVALAADNEAKMEDLAEYIDYFDADTIEKYLSGILAVVRKWPDEEKFNLWNKLSDIKIRILISRKESGTPDTLLYKHLCSTIEELAPQEKRILYRRLYLSNFDEYMLNEEDDVVGEWHKKEAEKKAAVSDIYASYGIEAVEQFGIYVNSLYDVGYKLGQTILVEDMQDIMQKGYTQAISATFLHSIVQGFTKNNGAETLLSIGLKNYDIEFISDILSQLDLSNDLLNVVPQLLSDDGKLFWIKVRVPGVLRADNDIDFQYIIDELIGVKRAVAAINLCGHVYGDLPVPGEEVASMLKLAATTESAEELDSHSACLLIKKLQDTKEPDIEKLSEIEFIYLPWLDELSSVHPRALYCKIASDPDYFCELLRLSYKKRHEDILVANTQSISPELLKRLFQILFKFCVVPGTDWDGNFHEDVFTSWLNKVKTWARDNDRYEIAMQTIGNGLSYARTDDSGIICESAIIKVLNAADSMDIRRGYSLGLINQRGAHFVDPEGKEEQSLEEKYTKAADKVEHQGYSRYSELLREIAANYISEAEQNALEEKLYREEDS